MDPKGPSGAFKRSSLKRSTSGSQKVGHMHPHVQQVLPKRSIFQSPVQTTCDGPALIDTTVYLEMLVTGCV